MSGDFFSLRHWICSKSLAKFWETVYKVHKQPFKKYGNTQYQQFLTQPELLAVPKDSSSTQRLNLQLEATFPCGTAYSFMTGAPSDRDCRWFEYENAPHRKMPTVFTPFPTDRRLSSSLHTANLFASLMAARRLPFSRSVFRANVSPGLFPQRVLRKPLDP
jgi:hypothetical protein